MTTNTLRLHLTDATGTPALLSEGWETIRIWRSRARQRRHLAMLTSAHLDDVGITAEAASREINKPFWRA